MKIKFKLFIVPVCFMIFSLIQPLMAFEDGNTGFVENKGQVVDEKGNERDDVLFTYENQNAKLFFFKHKVVYAFYRFEKEETPESLKKRKEGNIAAAEMLELRIRQQRIDLEFENALEPKMSYLDPLDHVINYYLGHCPEGIRNVPVFQKVEYENIYPNIDMVFKIDKKGIKYDIILHQGADISDIKLTYNGTEPLEIREGNLFVKNEICEYNEVIPESYYKDNNEPVNVGFTLYGSNTFGFDFENEALTKVENTIIIDPTLTWSTFFENTTDGSVSCIRGNSIVDENGNFFMQLNTYTADLPLANPGGSVYYDPNYHTSGLDIYFAKFDPDRNLLWSTYLGGDDGAQSNYYDHGMDTHAGYLYICGDTDSNDFPLTDQGGGAYYETYPGSSCGFLSKFDIATGEMVHSTYLKSYDYHSLSVDSQGNVAVISFNYDWSVTPDVMSRSGAYNQATHGGDSDIFIYMFDSDLNQIWGTFFGGAGYTDPMGIVFDSNDNMFMFSRSSSASAMIFEDPGGGAYFDNTYVGNSDMGISKFNTSGDLVWSTFYGGDGLEGLSYSNIDVNDNDDVIITSTTRSTNIYTYDQGGGAYYQGTPPSGLNDGMGGDPGCGIYARFDNNGVMLHSTYFGVDGESNYLQDQAQGNCNYEYLLFQTKDFPTTSLSGSYNVDNANTTEYNYMILEMDENFSIQWASYLQESDIYFQRLALDKPDGRLYATGSTESATYTTQDPGSGAYFDDTYDSGTGQARAIMEFSVNPGTVTIDNASASPSSVCSGTSTDITLTASSSETLASENVYWYTGSCGGTFIGTGNPVTVNETLTSSETYYVNYDNGCGTSPCVSTTVTVNPIPTANAGSNSPVCEGEDINLSETGGDANSWSWSGPNGFTSTGQNPTITSATTAASGTYTVEVTDVNGCTNTNAVDVTVNALPATPVADVDCSGGEGNGIITVTSPTGANYEYDIGTGYQSSASFGSLDNGTYVVTVSNTTTGCTAESAPIDLNCGCATPPTLTLNSTSGAVCGTNPVTVSGNTFGGSATEVNLSHDGSGTLDASNFTSSPFDFTYTPAPADAGSLVTITFTTDNPLGSPCTSATDTYELTVSDVPDAIAGSNSPVCEGEDINLTETGGDANSWSWSGPDGFTSTAQNPTITSATTAADGTYTVTITDASGCTNTDNITVNVNPSPAAPAVDVDCSGGEDAGIITVTSPTGGDYEYSIDGSYQASTSFGPLDNGLYTVTVMNVTTGCTAEGSPENLDCGCTDSPTLTLSSTSDSTCGTTPVTVSGNSFGGSATEVDLSHDGSGTLDASNFTSSPFEFTYTPDAADAGSTVTITLTTNNPLGSPCVSAQQLYELTVLPLPSVVVSSNSPVCDGEDVHLTETGGDGVSYNWTGPNGFSSTDQNPDLISVTTDDSGQYSVTVTDINGCTNFDVTDVSVSSTPDATINPAGPFCQYDAADTLTAATPGGIWTGPGITDSVQGTFGPSEASIGDNTITYEVSNGPCFGSDQITITVYEEVSAEILDAGPYCYGDFNVQLESLNPGGVWSGTYVDPDGIFDVGAAGAGVHDVSYGYTGTDVCGDTSHAEIVVYPANFDVDYKASDPSCYGGDNGSIEFEVSGGTSPYIYEWENNSSDTAYITGLSAGEYYFTITDVHGCFTEVTKIFLGEGDINCLQIPNVFTPNDDGVNDTWIIENLEFYPKATIDVYNRWGQLLYEGGAGTEPWDGTYNGKPVPTGSYVYVIRPFKGLEDITGIVTVVR